MKKKVMLTVIAIVAIAATTANADVLNVYLLAGQSNMEGQAYTYDSAETANWNVPTMEFLLSGTDAATAYLAAMPYGFKGGLSEDWLNPRDDVWAVHYNSGSGDVKNVLPTNNQADIVSGIQSLMPGFGVNTNFGSMFGAELGMGIRLGDALDSPVFLFKSSRGGTTLGINWRPPSAVAARGGDVGSDFANTMTDFIEFLDALDADLADDNVLNDYDNATGYVVAGVFWFQGWNEVGKAQLEAEYTDNLKDLIYSIRAADVRIPNDLPLIIAESARQDEGLNASRQAAVDQLNIEIDGSADFFYTDNMKDVNWGNNEFGVPFTTGYGSHYHARAESYLEIGWLAAASVLDNGFYLDDQTSLQFSVVGVTEANSVDTVSLYGAITDNADQVIVYWDTVDHGAASTGWTNSEVLGAWSGELGQIPVTLTGLQADTSYVFRYWANSSALADEAWSRAGEVKTDFSAEQVPSDMAANPINFAQIDLTWSEDFNTETGFVLRRSDDLNGTVNVVDVELPANATSYSDLSVTAVSTYYYQVAARNANGLSDFSEPVSITTPDVPEPQAAVITAYYDFEANGPEDDPCSLPYDPCSPSYDPLSHLTDKAGNFVDSLTAYDANDLHEFWSSDVPATTGSTTSASFSGGTALFTDAFTTDLGPDSNAYTIMFWVKGSDLDQENNNTRLMTSRIRPSNSGTGDNTWQIEGFGNNGSNGDNMDMRLQNDSDWITTNDAKLGSLGALANTGQTPVWHHVVFVVANSGHPDDAGAYAETYFDGVSVGLSQNPAPSWDGFNIANTKGQLIIGSTGETGGGRDFTGLLDDVALFSGVVTAEDIAAIAAGTLSPKDFIAADTDPPTPDPMTFASAPAATSDSAITMTATEATDYSGVEYYFTCTVGDGHDSDWQDSPVYTDTGLEPGTAYTYTVIARDKSENQNATEPSADASATTDSPDSESPTPDPMTWESVPAVAGINSVTMTATTATDPSGVEYYFTCTADGGNDSGWQDSPIYEDTGLTPGTVYTYTVTARDKSALQNTTAASTEESATPFYDGDAVLTAFYDFEPDSPLDDPAGDFADDLTGYNEVWSDDVPATTDSTQSASFDGNAALFTDAYSSDLGPGTDAYTIMFWIKASDLDQENSNTRLMTTRVGSSAGNLPWQVEGFGNDGTRGDRLDIRTYNGTAWINAPDAKSGGIGALANAGEEEVWHHVAFVVANSGHPDDAGAYAETFFNGVSVGVTGRSGENPLDESWDGFNIANPDGQLIIGSTGKTGGSRDFTGLLDDVALFSGVVTNEDIAAIAAGTLSPGLLTGTQDTDTDLTGDGRVDLADFAIFANNWLRSDCSEVDSCEGSDFNGDNSVDESDLAELASDWLQ